MNLALLRVYDFFHWLFIIFEMLACSFVLFLMVTYPVAALLECATGVAAEYLCVMSFATGVSALAIYYTVDTTVYRNIDELFWQIRGLR